MDHITLDAVLDNTQVPHQPFCVIVDSAVFSGLPLFRESLRRALNRGGPVVVVTALYDAASLSANGATIVPVGIPGYDTDIDEGTETNGLVEKITAAYKTGAQVYVDALDIIAEDHGSGAAMKIVRALLRLTKTSKAPSRLTLLLPHTSSLLPTLHHPTLSPAITLLYPHHPLLISHLSRSYLVAAEASAQFWVIIDRARARQLAEKLAYGGLDGVEVAGDWGVSSSTTGPSNPGGSIVAVLVRKPTGGVKGISRTLAAISPSPSGNGLKVCAVSNLITVNPVDAPGQGGAIGEKAVQTHVDLDLPFNLSLTDEQKRRRGEVPLPYAHEGEGVGIDFDEEEDEDEED